MKFRHVGENCPHEFLKLFSQSVRGCAIIHGGFLSVGFVAPYYTGFTEGKPLPFLKYAYFIASAGWRVILAGMMRGVHLNPMRISRIPAGSGKALEPRRDGKTEHNRQQPHYLAIILRRLAPLNEKWGKSSLKSRIVGMGTLRTMGTMGTLKPSAISPQCRHCPQCPHFALGSLP